ncbi:hypothetical protein A2533_05050 [Candidatus Falkowbacteria bacterium RIFOXYD2_FULL_35_9]|uniref:Toxic anion resistance protein n=1 Tax=Candidatus Falkowbacteria bacterium RIFOXYC2_FULL_36_12 TaxID=1798002 RepID=A0A1F5T0I0_9BACT|nr:MAG: hypothetical protein A2478_02870 [Candidatus Falkowbacteria bacterium RIFOXYC2_FULL_36_12]OGF34153.1 MAG: hypothetical protein A2223_01310 [Candidatus Falkowbacteria bacterium RIFOXYA2_FULL_35_8]OGF46426.1 MAG: hypothetical protein A2533_05050 [Candidatus Falkowbacteria bacterium RIFOXYD2_FULL_35_9]
MPSNSLTLKTDLSLPVLLKIDAVALSDQLEPLYDDVNNSADQLLSAIKVGDLQSAERLLGNLNKNLATLKKNSNKPGFLSRIFANAGKQLQRQIVLRQSLKTAIENELAKYYVARKQLHTNIDEFTQLARNDIELAHNIQKAIDVLDEQIEYLNQYKASQTPDPETEKQINKAIAVRQLQVSNLAGFRISMETNATIIAIQLAEREELYGTMGCFRPQLETLLKTELSTLIGQHEVRTAAATLQSSKEGLRAAVLMIAQMARQDAVRVIKATKEPIFDAETIQATTAEVMAMIDDVKTAVKDAQQKQAEAIKAANKASEDLKAKVAQMSRDEINTRLLKGSGGEHE